MGHAGVSTCQSPREKGDQEEVDVGHGDKVMGHGDVATLQSPGDKGDKKGPWDTGMRL